MTRRIAYTTFAIILIVIITMTLIIIDRPELSVAQSDDNIVSVLGEWRRSEPVTITTLGDGRYQIEPEWYTAGGRVAVSFDLSDGQIVYRWDADMNMWEPLTSAGIKTNHLGLFWVRDAQDVSAPDFVSQYNELLQMAPDDTVGYEIAVGVVADDGEVIRLLDKGDRGGCGGVVGHGSHFERSELEHEAHIFVDDVDTLVRFRFVGKWIVDESGCEEGSSLQSVL